MVKSCEQFILPLDSGSSVTLPHTLKNLLNFQLSERHETGSRLDNYGTQGGGKQGMQFSFRWLCVGFSESDFFTTYLVNNYAAKNPRRNITKASKAIDILFANLCLAHSAKSYLITPFNACLSNKAVGVSFKVIIPVIRFFESLGLIELTLGKRNEYEHIATTCKPTGKLINLIQKHRIKVMLDKKQPFTIKRGKKTQKGQPAEQKKILQKEQKAFAELDRPVRRYNELMLAHDVTLGGQYLFPFCRRIFSNNSLELGGRFYNSVQQLPKAERAKILINKARTIEPDFKSLHINLLYAMKDIQYEADDPYDVQGYDRNLIKSVILRLLNSGSIKTLAGQVTKSGTEQIKEINRQYKYYRAAYERGEIKTVYKPECLEGFIEGIPTGINGHDLIEEIKQTHSPISDLLGSKDIGLRLQYKDAQIMARILEQMVATDTPSIPIHDSIIIRESDRQMINKIMRDAYHEATGNHIQVNT